MFLFYFNFLLLIIISNNSNLNALIIQTKTIGKSPQINYNMKVSGSSTISKTNECTHFIAKGFLNTLFLYLRFDPQLEIQSSITDMFLSIRIVNDKNLSSIKFLNLFFNYISYWQKLIFWYLLFILKNKFYKFNRQ